MINEPENLVRKKLYDAVSNDDVDRVRLLISQQCVSQYGISSALSLSASLGNLQISRILIDAGADLNNDYGGMTTLTEAIYEGHIEIVRMLIEAGVDISYPEYGEVSLPLALAASKGNLEIVKLLVEAGANVNQISQSSGEHALNAAAGAGHIEVFNYLAPLTNSELREEAEKILPLGIHQRELEENVDPLVQELSDCFLDFMHDIDVNRVREILENGVNINAYDEVGNTALNLAVTRNHIEVVSMLLKAGANPNLANDDDHLPIESSRSDEITALLISAGAKKVR